MSIGADEQFDTVLVVDFGAQYAQLIARRVREARVYSEIVPHTITAAELAERAPAGIIFSLEKGEVWASWHGSGPPMRLGSQERVEAMMEDFLAQGELGKRLTGTSE